MKILGEKLRQARIIRNKSITELADEIGVSKQAVFQYENNEIEPKNETILKIISSLNFPARFFTEKFTENLELRNTFFRARMSANKIDKLSWEERAKFVTLFYKFLSEYLELPPLNLPQINNSIIEEKDYDKITAIIREHWNLGQLPAKNMVKILEENGIIISTLEGAKEIDAFTQTYQDKSLYCVIIEDIKNSMARRNFNIAHELGHIVLHSYTNFEELDKEEKVRLEREADKFAASFLLPAKEFNEDLRFPTHLKSYIALKQKWYVSILSMIMRAKDLDRINEYEYISLIKSYNYYKYRTNEPLDAEIPIKKPSLFKQSLEILFDNNILNYDTFMDELDKNGLSLYQQDILKFFSLDAGFFTAYKNDNNIIKLKFHKD